MTGHSYIGAGAVIGIIALLVAAVLTGWTPIFAILIVFLAIVLAPIVLGARRAAGGTPEGSGDIEETSDPNAPPDATPKAPHGYTPST
jgi:hypothetical protein